MTARCIPSEPSGAMLNLSLMLRGLEEDNWGIWLKFSERLSRILRITCSKVKSSAESEWSAYKVCNMAEVQAPPCEKERNADIIGWEAAHHIDMFCTFTTAGENTNHNTDRTNKLHKRNNSQPGQRDRGVGSYQRWRRPQKSVHLCIQRWDEHLQGCTFRIAFEHST